MAQQHRASDTMRGMAAAIIQTVRDLQQQRLQIQRAIGCAQQQRGRQDDARGQQARLVP